MLGGILAFRRHLRIQFERLEVDFCGNLVIQFCQRLLQ
jgi:hypothetical protein